MKDLRAANIHFAHGELVASLDAVDAALRRLDEAHPIFSDVVAFRIFLTSMINQQSGRWRTDTTREIDVETGSPRTMTLCVSSSEKWHSGSLRRGLALNFEALRHARNGPPAWRVYAYMLLAKKLTDIHARARTLKVIDTMQRLIERSGLYVLKSLRSSMHAAIRLQAGQFDEAIHLANDALRTAQLCSGTVGVKLSLSVSAMACVGLGDLDQANVYLNEYHAEPTQYVLPDSKARAAATEIALVAASEGARAAADRIRSDWHLLSAESAAFVEDLSRPAWLVTVARSAGDTALAERSLQAVDWLARNNPSVPVLETAAQYARRAFDGDPTTPPSILDVDRHHLGYAATPPPVPLPRQAEQESLPALSRREGEIARLVGRGMTNRQVANQLGLSPHTVNFHLRGIYRKLSISTRVQLSYIVAKLEPPRDQREQRDQRDQRDQPVVPEGRD